MGRGDHHAELGVVGARQISRRRCGQHPDPQRVDAFAGDPRDHGRLEHLAAGPRVAADHRHAAACTGNRAEPARRRGPDGQRQLRGQFAVGNTAHAVGTEQSTHADKLLTIGRRRHNWRGHRSVLPPNPITAISGQASPPAPGRNAGGDIRSAVRRGRRSHRRRRSYRRSRVLAPLTRSRDRVRRVRSDVLRDGHHALAAVTSGRRYLARVDLIGKSSDLPSVLGCFIDRHSGRARTVQGRRVLSRAGHASAGTEARRSGPQR